jgi:predicted membrane protein
MANKLLVDTLSAPLDGARTAKVDIDTRTGNLAIDRLDDGDHVLASGTLQYFEKQGVPDRSVSMSNGQAKLTLRGGGSERSWFRFPWAACIGGTDWQIHLNPAVSSDITAHSGGGNVRLDLTGMAVTRVAADSGGGNMEVVLPEDAANLSVTARTGGGNVSVDVGRGTSGSNTVDATSGAGNVDVRVPSNLAARIHATSGWGKVIVDSRFSKVDGSTYQSPDFDGAANRIEITAKSGAGSVSVNTK